MKKRVVFGLVSAALAAVMCIGFAGCGGSKAESIKGEEVTEKQWDKAFDYFTEEDAKYTISYSEEWTTEYKFVYLDEKLSGSGKDVRTIDAVKNGAKEYVKQTDTIEFSGDMKKIAAALDDEVEEKEETEETYAEFKSGAYTVYTQDDDDKWGTSQADRTIIPFERVTGGLSFDYSSYEYSSDMKGYILKGAIKNGYMYVVKFNSDGQLSAISYTLERTTKSGSYEETTTRVLSVVIEYKADEITLPTVG